jgi:hypothetical protein
MVKLNLTVSSPDDVILKDYLENNASEALAEKINNGVRIEKDGKTLINKKTLETYKTYASQQAQKQAIQCKGFMFAMVGDATIISWLIHFFEEDSIEGTLYNLDGTEYKAPATVKQSKPSTISKHAADKPKLVTLFDYMDKQEQDTKLAEFEVDIPQEPEQTTPSKAEIEPTASETIIVAAKPVEQETVEIPAFITKLFGDLLKVEVAI